MNFQDLLLESYNYLLPEEQIATRPASPRDHSKLLVYSIKDDLVTHTQFKNIAEFLPQNSLLVRNNSKVFPCRLIGKKSTGGKAEFFILSLKSEEIAGQTSYPCLIKTRSKKYPQDEFIVSNKKVTIVDKRDENSFWVSFEENSLEDLLYSEGKVPIPPYIREGESDEQDKQDYQTLYAKELGSVAAPTAGLHFTERVFEDLQKHYIQTAEVTLHVGLGTFAPVRVENIKDHKMHHEVFTVSSENQQKIQDHSNNLIAVGTTSLRVLESSLDQSGNFEFSQYPKSTDIFLHPGKEIKSIRGLLTNFHLPKSTLLMLVSALLGREKTLELYELAVREKYRFFSYGDAMLILR